MRIRHTLSMWSFVAMIVFVSAAPLYTAAQTTTDATSTSVLTNTTIATTTIDAATTTTPFVVASTTVSTTTTDAVATTTTATTSTPIVLPVVHSNAGLESQVRAYFIDIPTMLEIARCESRFRQYDTSGNVLNGGSGQMMGLFQIYAPLHRAKALSLGFDIDTPEGNMGYARYLYQKGGTAPWMDSFSCWKSVTTNAEVTTSAPGTPTLYSDLALGMINDQVLTLQKMLNAQGFTIATEGPGSPGNETNKFGSFTRMAVRNFQCAKVQVCSGDESTTGYGFVGARTRAALLGTVSTTIVPPPAMQQQDPNAQEIARLTALIQVLTQQLNSMLTKRS